MKSLILLSSAIAVLLPFQAMAEKSWDPLIGKDLSNGYAVVVVNDDGTLGGGFAEGTWWEENGKFCREITSPKLFAGTECQTVEIEGNEARFTGPDGNTRSWTIE